MSGLAQKAKGLLSKAKRAIKALWEKIKQLFSRRPQSPPLGKGGRQGQQPPLPHSPRQGAPQPNKSQACPGGQCQLGQGSQPGQQQQGATQPSSSQGQGQAGQGASTGQQQPHGSQQQVGQGQHNLQQQGAGQSNTTQIQQGQGLRQSQAAGSQQQSAAQGQQNLQQQDKQGGASGRKKGLSVRVRLPKGPGPLKRPSSGGQGQQQGGAHIQNEYQLGQGGAAPSSQGAQGGSADGAEQGEVGKGGLFKRRKADYKGKYALSPDFDSYHRALAMARVLEDSKIDAEFNLAVTAYAYLTHHRLYDESELEDRKAKLLLKRFEEEIKPRLEGAMLYINPSDAAVIAKEILKRLRKKRGVKDVADRAQYISDYADLVEAFEGAKGRDRVVTEILSADYLDEERLKVARQVVAVAKAVGRKLATQVATSRKLGQGFEPAGVGNVKELYELARLHPMSQVLLTNTLGLQQLAAGELQAVKTYAIGSKEREKIKRLGVLVDVSGSMAGQEIVYATGIAIALFMAFKPYRKRLGFFNAQVQDVLDTKRLLDELLRVQAGGGTNIAEAVYHACAHWKDVDRIIVVTDGRDDPPRAPRNCNVSYVITTLDGWRNYGWDKVKNAWLVAKKGDKIVVEVK